MRRISGLVTASILLNLCLGSQLGAQIISVTNAPVTAAVKSTEDGGLTYSTVQLARASNGSTYAAEKTKDGRKKKPWASCNKVKNLNLVL